MLFTPANTAAVRRFLPPRGAGTSFVRPLTRPNQASIDHNGCIRSGLGSEIGRLGVAPETAPTPPKARQGLLDYAMNFILVRLLQLDILDIQCAS